MDFTNLLSMFAPRPQGNDPFAMAHALATNPDTLAPQLATLGPPPPKGQSVGDFFAQKAGNAYGNAANPRMGGPFPQAPQPQPVEPGPVVSGNPTAPSPLITAGSPISDVPGVGPVPNELMLPGMPDAGALALPGYTGAPQVPGVGPVPTIGGEERDLQSGPTPPGAISVTPGGGRKPEILAREDERHVPQKDEEAQPTKMDPAKQKAIQDAMKGLGGLLTGLKAPPAPETQKISSPSAPRPTGTIQGGGIAALLSQMAGSTPPAVPLRLGNALYAGGRGLY
jgi:hypothetical protein